MQFGQWERGVPGASTNTEPTSDSSAFFTMPSRRFTSLPALVHDSIACLTTASASTFIPYSGATTVSADGSTVVGNKRDFFNPNQTNTAFVWTSDGGLITIDPDLSPGA